MMSEKDCEAAAQYAAVCELLDALRKAREASDDRAIDEAYDAVYANALSVEVRSGWQAVGSELKPSEYAILLCTGGPAVRIVGELDQYSEPSSARLEWQNWFTPWSAWADADESKLLQFAACFYFANN
jgi:hypothetical protein